MEREELTWIANPSKKKVDLKYKKPSREHCTFGTMTGCTKVPKKKKIECSPHNLKFFQKKVRSVGIFIVKKFVTTEVTHTSDPDGRAKKKSREQLLSRGGR